MTEAQRKKIRYRAIRNAYNDPKLAKEFSSRSDKEIYNLIGVKVPKKLPDLKPLRRDRKYVERKEQELENVRFYLNSGIDPVRANYLKRRGYTKRNDFVDRELQYVIPFTKGKIMPVGSQERARREVLWVDWSTHEGITRKEITELKKKRKDTGNMPPYIERLARTINSKNGFDATDKFGYAVVYYAYTMQLSVEEVLSVSNTGMLDGNIYRIETSKL